MASSAAPLPRGDEETLLERTISTDGPVNLDQSDPLAEADFHMAYGLYDQAADLLTAAMAREPARRDLHLKLLDVYFVWENREGLPEGGPRAARARRHGFGSGLETRHHHGQAAVPDRGDVCRRRCTGGR